MGILGLNKVLDERAPGHDAYFDLKHYTGRTLAIDASMTIYQFLIAMRSGYGAGGQANETLTSGNGETTAHLNGLFARTLRMLDEGVRPVYVFDGEAPEMKRKLLENRRERVEMARNKAMALMEEGDAESAGRMAKQTVRLDTKTVEESKRLLKLMGVAVVQSPGEAEAQCVELVKCGKAYAVVTEDMDALTFGAPIMLRHLSSASSKRGRGQHHIRQYTLDTLLQRLYFTQEQFIDLCILLGCDYGPKIKGVGPKTAFEGIRKHKHIEGFLATLNNPTEIPFNEMRELFRNPNVTSAEECDVRMGECDADGLCAFLVGEKGFSEERVRAGIERLRKARLAKTQLRLDSFFSITKPTVRQPATVAVGGGKGSKREEVTRTAMKLVKGHKGTHKNVIQK